MGLEERIMAHERIRVGTTKGGPMLPDIDFEACQAVRAGNLVFLVGLTGFDRDTMEFVGAGDPAAQAKKAMENARALLDEAGARMEDICKITTYVTEREYRKDVYAVIARHLRGVHPVSTGLVVKGLAETYIDFEIDIFAVIPDERSVSR